MFVMPGPTVLAVSTPAWPAAIRSEQPAMQTNGSLSPGWSAGGDLGCATGRGLRAPRARSGRRVCLSARLEAPLANSCDAVVARTARCTILLETARAKIHIVIVGHIPSLGGDEVPSFVKINTVWLVDDGSTRARAREFRACRAGVRCGG
jgi:hypothetical protein